MSALLEAESLTVKFGGITAVDDVSLSVETGTVTGLIGPNGAGKTTLFNALTGMQDLVDGRILLDGSDITSMKVHQRARRGMARTFQRLEIFKQLTTLDNVMVATEMRRRWSLSARSPRSEALECLDRVGLLDLADSPAALLPTGAARLVEVARALATRPRVLLLDEPSSGLNDSETRELSKLVRQLADDGLAVLLVEHDMSFVMEICDVINVLALGQTLAVGTPSQIRSNPAVQASYLGHEQSSRS